MQLRLFDEISKKPKRISRFRLKSTIVCMFCSVDFYGTRLTARCLGWTLLTPDPDGLGWTELDPASGGFGWDWTGCCPHKDCKKESGQLAGV